MKLLQLGQLFALPLQSAIKAQNLALQEMISFIEQFGLEDGCAKTFQFKAERMVEERILDPKTGITDTKFKVQPFEVSIPLLALVSPPNIQLQEMNIEYGVEIVEPKTEPIKSSVIPSTVKGFSLASSQGLFTSISQTNPTTMKVNMKIVRETPEGLARLGDILTDLLSGKAKSPEVPPPKSKVPIDKITGLGSEAINILKAKGIHTVNDFVSSTKTRKVIKIIAKNLKIPEKQLVDLREKAKLLVEEK